ncbi:DMT family transporter [Leekyejoonella antrihumi]|uniref:EamA family transporter n=1 Tax=Leekyejoonella antrihumi TaxID=1660198 RepID=A0A563EAV2_9MICO|nr:DMT family transporter [Leekyejoonella antrihumi]TWP38924.1 EamA family transporter [Leekyejoonella antrihumi]
MSGQVLGLILAAALFHAIWNITAKRVTSDGYPFVWCYVAAGAVIWLPIGIVLLIRSGGPWTWWLLVAPAVSAVLHIAYSLTLQTGYARADLSVVYPVARGTGPLITMAVAVLALGERPGWFAVGGGMLVILGVVIVAAGTRGHATSAQRAITGLQYGGATGCAIAAYTLWDDHGMTALALAPIPYFSLNTAFEALLLSPGLRRHPPVLNTLRRHWREVLTVGVLSPLAYILVLQAMRTTSVALVAPARESSIVVGSLLAWWLFKEPNPLRRLLGAAVVLAGIALIVRV